MTAPDRVKSVFTADTVPEVERQAAADASLATTNGYKRERQIWSHEDGSLVLTVIYRRVNGSPGRIRRRLVNVRAVLTQGRWATPETRRAPAFLIISLGTLALYLKSPSLPILLLLVAMLVMLLAALLDP